MYINKRLAAKNVALTICFSALYVLLGFVSLSPIIGLPGKTITAATIVTPIIGIILGIYIGVLSTILGGLVGFFAGFLSLPSFFSGITAALCAGMLYMGKRIHCVFVYLLLFLLFSFFPYIGPVWLYPPFIWFQMVGFLILISPIQTSALKHFNSETNSNLFFSFLITSLTSTLAGQIAGSLILEVLMPYVSVWKAVWPLVTFLYPIERIVIAFCAALIGASLYKVLKRVYLKDTSIRGS